MIEMAIIAMIVSSVTLRVAGNVAVDGFFAARGMESPRLAGARKRRPRGAASAYWSEVWADAWTGASAKRAARRANPGSTSRPRGAATSFWAGWLHDQRRATGRAWDRGWTRLDERRREKASRPRPGQVTVPGTVVPNAQDENRPRPQDETQDGPQDKPTPVPDEDGPKAWAQRKAGLVCSRCGTTEQVKWWGILRPAAIGEFICIPCHEALDCKYCADEGLTSGCPKCGKKKNDPNSGPDSGPDQDPSSPATPTTKGPTIMTITMPSADVAGFEPTIKWGEASAQGYRAMINEVELCISKLQAAKVTDEALMSDLTSVMEMSSSAANSMESAMTKLAAHRGVAEAYHATPGAGEKEFMLNG